MQMRTDPTVRMPPGHMHSGHGEQHGHAGHHAHMAADFRKRFWICLIVTLPVLALSPMIRRVLGIERALAFPGSLAVLFGLSTLILVYGGRPFFRGFLEEIGKRSPGMMTLITVAVASGYVYSGAVVLGVGGKVFFWELATLIDVMLLGHWIEMRSVMGASRALEELAHVLPSEAHAILPDGSQRDVPIDTLRVGDRYLVKPGERIPADGEIVEGETSLDEALITGESQPVPKTRGDTVIGGTINGEGSITVGVAKIGKEAYLAQVMDLVRKAQETKSRTQDLANRAAMWLTVIALAAGALTLIVWLVALQKGFTFALERAVTVMVITCPHALGLAVPLVVAVTTAISARNGLLVRDRAAFEKARRIQAILFDKTGTLTVGKFGITDVIPLTEGISAGDLLLRAASVESRSEHPIAKAISGSSKALLPVEGFKAIPGRGAEGLVDGTPTKVVGPGYLRENGIRIGDPRPEKLASDGKTVVYVLLGAEVAGAIGLADTVRPESRAAIAALKRMGIRAIMITGDNERVARRVAEEIGIEEYFAEVLPEEKARKIQEVQARGLIAAMAGDGINDAPALAQADVGIAIGAGTDVAIEAADIVLTRSNPADAVSILGLARATYRKMVQNLIWATGYNIIAIPLAAGVLSGRGIVLSPAAGAALMSLSTVIVAINARLIRIPRGPDRRRSAPGPIREKKG
jgi:Cu2+-exporting ATPase